MPVAAPSSNVPSDPPTSATHSVDSDALLRRIQRLELVARQNAAGLTSGDYETSVRGQGLIYFETRKYVAGESARSIEWNVTARLGEPYVKVHEEERRRDVWIGLDVSPSMHLGFQDKTKLEHAVELAATLALAAVDSGDRVGYVLFADRVLAESRPRAGQRQLFQVLRALLDHTAPWQRPVEVSDPRTAVYAIERHRRGRFVVFLISDFIDRDVPDDLRYFRPRHDVTLLHVFDPTQLPEHPPGQLPGPGQPPGAGQQPGADLPTAPVRFTGVSPEGPQAERDASRRVVRPGDAGALHEMQDFLRQRSMALGLDFTSCSTKVPVTATLRTLLHRKQRRRARRPR